MDAAGCAETPPLTFLTSHFESEKSQGAPRCQQFSQTLRRLTRDPGALCVFGGDTNLRCVPSLRARLAALSQTLSPIRSGRRTVVLRTRVSSCSSLVKAVVV